MDPIGIVGAGAVGRLLGRLLNAHGLRVSAVTSRTGVRAEEAAAIIGAGARAVSLAEMARSVARVIVATSDGAIEVVASELAAAGFRSGLAVHTCGSLSADALGPLRQAGVSCGVFHPFQTITAGPARLDTLEGVTFGTTGDTTALEWADEMARALGGRTIRIDPTRMAAYHAAAVMAGNSLNAVVDAALLLLERAGVDRDAALHTIAPLGRTTLNNIIVAGPAASLTGPIARGDSSSVKAHLDALATLAPELLPLYEAVARRLIGLAVERGLTTARVSDLQSALGV